MMLELVGRDLTMSKVTWLIEESSLTISLKHTKKTVDIGDISSCEHSILDRGKSGMIVIKSTAETTGFFHVGEGITYSNKKINQKENADKICEFIINYSKQPQAAANSGVSAVDEIKKYKELLDSGILTQEEFDVKKKQLLDL